LTRFIRPTGHVRRRRLVAAIAFAAVLAVAASVVGLSRAGSVRTGVTIQVLPHVLTLNTSGTTQGLLASDFTNAGPSTVNHVFETITTNAPSGTVFTPTSSDCTASGSTITCNIGQVAPGTVTRLISFTIPANTAPFTFNVSISTTFDEGKGSGLTDTVTGSDSGTFVSTTDGTRKGQCLPGQGGSLTGSNGNQQTFLTYPGLPTAFVPCTPGAAGVNAGLNNVKGEFGDTSFVEFLNGNGLATVQITLFDPPPGVKKSNLFFVEYANYPNPTPTNNGAPVPNCQTVNGVLTIPPNSGFVSCVVSITNNPGGGLLATLLAQGGNDSGWGTGA
jgi:hypothetical protein